MRLLLVFLDLSTERNYTGCYQQGVG